MASLADLVLGAGDLDELEIEDEDLTQQLEELNALRAAVNPVLASAADSQSTNAVVPKKAVAAPPRDKVSLADKILPSSDGVDDLDREFQVMEKELQQQLLKYKEQCQDSDRVAVVQAPPAATAQDSSTTAGSSRPSSKSSAHKEQALPSAAEVEDPGSEEITPELLNLRAEAAQMQEVFPDPEAASHEAPARSRHRRVGRTGYERSSDPAPDDFEIADLKQQLSGLDLRMGAIQQMHAMHDVRAAAEQAALPPAAARAVAELQAQNAHLRERFQASNKRGLLRLDGSFFGASAEKPPSHAFGSSVAGASQLESKVGGTNEVEAVGMGEL